MNFLREKIDVTVSPEFLRMKEIALPEIKNETKSFSDKSLEFSCEYYYGFENNTLVCSVRNTNNFEIPSFLFCTADKSDCTNTDLKINEVKTLSLRSKQDNETLIYEYKTPQKGKQSGSFEVLLKEPTLSLSQRRRMDFILWSMILIIMLMDLWSLFFIMVSLLRVLLFVQILFLFL